MDNQVDGRGLGKDQDKEMNRISLLQSHHRSKRVGMTHCYTFPAMIIVFFFFNRKIDTEIGETISLSSYSELWRSVGTRITNLASQTDCIRMQPSLLPRQFVYVCTSASYCRVPTTLPNSERCSLHRGWYFPALARVSGQRRGGMFIWQHRALCTRTQGDRSVHKDICESFRQISREWSLENWK